MAALLNSQRQNFQSSLSLSSLYLSVSVPLFCPQMVFLSFFIVVSLSLNEIKNDIFSLSITLSASLSLSSYSLYASLSSSLRPVSISLHVCCFLYHRYNLYASLSFIYFRIRLYLFPHLSLSQAFSPSFSILMTASPLVHGQLHPISQAF